MAEKLRDSARCYKLDFKGTRFESREHGSAILKTKPVVQPVAIVAPIGSNGDRKCQFCEPLALLPVYFSVAVGTAPMVVSC
jgi:hypothetical protein